MYPNLTGRDTITYFANLRGGVDRGYVDELADRLEADLTKKVGDLSSGNRQKVGLIQAFMNRPRVLIMDEPSSGLDPLIQREFQASPRHRSGKRRSLRPPSPLPAGTAAHRRRQPGNRHGVVPGVPSAVLSLHRGSGRCVRSLR